MDDPNCARVGLDPIYMNNVRMTRTIGPGQQRDDRDPARSGHS